MARLNSYLLAVKAPSSLLLASSAIPCNLFIRGVLRGAKPLFLINFPLSFEGEGD
jgi:hypothetical protein